MRPDSHAIVRLDPDGNEALTLGGDGPEEGGMNYPVQLVSTSEGRLVVVEAGGGVLSVYDADGAFVRNIGEAGHGPGQLYMAADAVVDSMGYILVADTGNNRIQVFEEETGEHAWSFGQLGQEEGDLNGPRSLTIDHEGYVHVVDSGNARVCVFTPGGRFERCYGNDGTNALVAPRAVSIDPLGNSWVSDPVAAVVQVYAPDGSHLARFESLTLDGIQVQPLRVALTPDDTFYIQVNLVEVD